MRAGAIAAIPAWEGGQLAEAAQALAARAGLVASHAGDAGDSAASAAGSHPPGAGAAAWDPGAVAAAMGVEAEPVQVGYGEVEALLLSGGPALLPLVEAAGGPPRWVALLRGGRRRVTLLGPDYQTRRVRRGALRAALCDRLEGTVVAEVEALLAAAGVPPHRAARARAALLSQRLGGQALAAGWLLRETPGSGFGEQLRRAGLLRRLGALVAAHAVHYVLWILSFALVGRAALSGRLDRGWLLGWALLLLTLVPWQLLVTWLQGSLALGAGALLKRRLLAGALRLPPDATRRQGVGQLLARVLEADALESLALSGGLLALVSLVELAFAAGVLALGAGAPGTPALLVAWTVVAGGLAWRYGRRRREWTAARRSLTHAMVEGLLGHRTRLVQEDPASWHAGEDEALVRYAADSRAVDAAAVGLLALVPRGWLLLALLALAPAIAGGVAPTALAVAIGGVLLAFRALRRLAAGVSHLAEAAIAWEQVADLFHAGAGPEEASPSPLADGAVTGEAIVTPGPAARLGPAVEAHGLVFRHEGRAEPVLRGCSLAIGAGDRLLLEGPSGAGKSTFAALLAGLRRPDAGLLLAGGLDLPSLGAEGWRRRVATAPQFHENHVLTGSFAFNALLGRTWPPRAEDLAEAETLCRDLGLGPLLDRMPAGIHQMLGDTGWQLSHGERSRLFMARALLQRADVVLLDESFAALDPESFGRCLDVVLAQPAAVLVVAHP